MVIKKDKDSYKNCGWEEPSIWGLNLDYSTTPLNIYSAATYSLWCIEQIL